MPIEGRGGELALNERWTGVFKKQDSCWSADVSWFFQGLPFLKCAPWQSQLPQPQSGWPLTLLLLKMTVKGTVVGGHFCGGGFSQLHKTKICTRNRNASWNVQQNNCLHFMLYLFVCLFLLQLYLAAHLHQLTLGSQQGLQTKTYISKRIKRLKDARWKLLNSLQSTAYKQIKSC